MRPPIPVFCLLLAIFFLPSTAQAQSDEEAVAAILDALHEAASQADGTRYFDLFAEEAVFLGTDITERWTVPEFKAYALPFFEQGRGWTYTPTTRFIYLAADGQTAWFDETLDNANLGACRGTGVLVKAGDAWKVAQYNLTIPIPNDLASQVVEMIRAQDQEP